jgi:hypothetical protein
MLHSQVSEPEKWVDAMADAGVSQFIFHIETTETPVELIEKIKAKGMKVCGYVSMSDRGACNCGCVCGYACLYVCIYLCVCVCARELTTEHAVPPRLFYRLG